MEGTIKGIRVWGTAGVEERGRGSESCEVAIDRHCRVVTTGTRDGSHVLPAGRRDTHGVSRENTGVGYRCSAALRERKAEQCATRILSADEECRRSQSENESLMTTSTECKVRMRNLEKKLEEEVLHGVAAL